MVAATRALAFMAASLACLPAVADTAIDSERILEQQRNIVRVVMTCSRVRSHGTGTYLGAGLVITCEHVVTPDPGDGQVQAIEVVFPELPWKDIGIETHAASVIAKDAKWDQALLQLAAEPSERGIKLADADVAPGDLVVFGGFGDAVRSDMSLKPGRVIGNTAPDVSSAYDYIELSGPSRDGDSGGPILNARGEFVGNLWGSGRRTTVGLSLARTRVFLGDRAKSLTGWGQSSGGWSAAPPTTCAPSSRQVAPTIRLDYDRLAAAVVAQPGFAEKCKGAPGQPGERGEQGGAATLGPAEMADLAMQISVLLKQDQTFIAACKGGAPEIDLDVVAAEVQKRLPGINYVVGEDPTTGRQQLEEIPLGGVLPPIYMRKVDGNTGELLSPPEAIHLGMGYTFILHGHADQHK